jgi:hypothetical protein
VPDIQLRVVARKALALVFEIARIDVTHADSANKTARPWTRRSRHYRARSGDQNE